MEAEKQKKLQDFKTATDGADAWRNADPENRSIIIISIERRADNLANIGLHIGGSEVNLSKTVAHVMDNDDENNAVGNVLRRGALMHYADFAAKEAEKEQPATTESHE